MNLHKALIANEIFGNGGSGGGGSSDFSIANVTITCDNGNLILLGYSTHVIGGLAISPFDDELMDIFGAPPNTPTTWKVVMYKGLANFDTSDDPTTLSVAVTGSIEYDNGTFHITGDGTITITSI